MGMLRSGDDGAEGENGMLRSTMTGVTGKASAVVDAAATLMATDSSCADCDCMRLSCEDCPLTVCCMAVRILPRLELESPPESTGR